MCAKIRCGFTLIELLVVISIIAIVAAFLFPVFAQARERARNISCISNTRQIALAEAMYLQDYDEFFWSNPPGAGADPNCTAPSCSGTVFWSDLLMPYVKNIGVFNCPSNSDDLHDTGLYMPPAQPVGSSNYYRVTYGFIVGGPHADPRFGPWSLSMLERPAQIALVADAVYAWNYPNCENNPDKQGRGSWYFTMGRNGWDFLGKPRHFGGLNLVYADGHAKFGKPARSPVTAHDAFAGYYPTAIASDQDCQDFTW
jgi:prepilin-type N-terminal cleavage/methylation domain-containing protein/prepilin-type processing-associated H-X9-DG protein